MKVKALLQLGLLGLLEPSQRLVTDLRRAVVLRGQCCARRQSKNGIVILQFPFGKPGRGTLRRMFSIVMTYQRCHGRKRPVA